MTGEKLKLDSENKFSKILILINSIATSNFDLKFKKIVYGCVLTKTGLD